MLRGLRYAAGYREAGGAAPAAATPGANPLRDFFEARRAGPGIWKWTHYFDLYHRHLARFVGRQPHVMEIGVYSGGSLDMWRAYFGAGCRIYGVDLQPACKVYEREDTRIFIGDQGDRAFWRSLQLPALDVLIDDGGHRPEQQIATLEEMLPRLRPGGVFLCEDIHGMHNRFGAYLEGLLKDLNAFLLGRRRQAGAAFGAAGGHPVDSLLSLCRGDREGPAPVTELDAPRHGTEWQPFKL